MRNKILESLKLNTENKDILDMVVKNLKEERKIIDKHNTDLSNSEEYRKSREEINSATDINERTRLRQKQKTPKFYSEENDPITKLEKLSNKKDNIEDHFEQLEKKLLNKLNTPTETIQKNPQITEEKKICDIYVNLDKYYNNYIEHRKNFNKISDSSIKGYNASMRYLKYFINEDTIFNFRFFKDIQKKLQNLPKVFFKYSKYYKSSYEDLLTLKEKENFETLNSKTINNHINSYSLFFKYLKYEEIVEENPLNDIIPLNEVKGTIKEEYSDNELKLIFESDMEKPYLNMCRIALYCGLRIEEVLSIKKENIKDNLIYIDLEDTSTKNHQRIIPIHKNIINTVNNQIKTNKGIFLFFNGNGGNEVKNVGKRLNRRIQDIVSSKIKTYHSFRKNFSQVIELETNAEEKTKTYLMGHSNNSVTHTIYNRGKFNVKKLVDCIEQINYEY